MDAMTEAKKKAMEELRGYIPKLDDYNKGWFAGVCQAMGLMLAASADVADEKREAYKQ